MNFTDLNTFVDFNSKIESRPRILCQCCITDSNLRNMQQPFLYDNKVEVYAEMLKNCFSIEVNRNEYEGCQYFICDECIHRLRNCYFFRSQVVEAQLLLNTQCRTEIQYQSYTVSDDLKLEDQFATSTYSMQNINSGDIFAEQSMALININSVAKESHKKGKNFSELIQLPTEPEYSFQDDNLLNLTGAQKFSRLSKEEKRTKAREREARLLPFKLDITDLTCQICKETFSAHKGLLSHMAVHYPNYICDSCGKQFVRKSALRSHINRTHNIVKIPCNICNRLLKKHYMTRHMRTHTGKQELPNTCPFCPERFVSYVARVKHMTTIHNMARGEYKCTVCPRTFKSGSSRSTHVRKDHLKQKKHVCTICKHAFFAKRNLTKHMITHTGEKNFQCTICLKSYGREFTLKEHKKIHDDVKNHQCGVCEKAFTHRTTLRNHMRTHNNIKPGNSKFGK